MQANINSYNAKKVVSFVAPSGEQELTKSIKVNPFSYGVFSSLFVPNHKI